MVKIEIVYIDANNTCIQIPLALDEPCTVQKALELSNIYTLHPETKDYTLGIFSKPVELDTFVKDGARIEIYRPLSMDPKDKRKAKVRALKKREAQLLSRPKTRTTKN